MNDTSSHVATELDDLAKTFLKDEQKQRRTEIEALISRIEGDQRYGLAITGLVWSWLATNHNNLEYPFELLVVFMPTILTSFFLWRWNCFESLISTNAEYTRTLEDHAALPKGFGWETFMDNKRRLTGMKDHLKTFTRRFWRALIAFNFFVALLFVLLPIVAALLGSAASRLPGH